jgi:hypothetical protein
MIDTDQLTRAWLHATAILLEADRDSAERAVRAMPDAGEPAIDAAAAALATTLPPGPAAGLALLLSAQRSDAEPALRRAARLLCETALAAAPAGGAAIAVRLARLSYELGDTEAASAAWAEAVRRDARLAWLLRPEQRADPVVQAALAEAARGDEVRDAIERLVAGGARDAALADLREAKDDRDGAARLVLAAERLRDAALLPAGDPAAAAAIDEVLDRAAGLDVPLRGILRAAALVVRGDRAGARAELGDAPDGAIDALAEVLRRPPNDPRSWLAEAYFDALFDPLSGLVVPRSALARLRRMVLGVSIAAMLGSVGCASAGGAGGGGRLGVPEAALQVEGGTPSDLEPSYFADAESLEAPAADPAARAKALRDLVWADVSGSNPGAVLRMFAATPKKDKDELRYAIADAMADAELQEAIEANQARHTRALEIAVAIAPRDLSVAENAAADQAVGAFGDWERYPYQVIVVPGYVPLDADAPVKLTDVARARLDEAVAAFREGQAPFILVSGANVHPHNTPYYEAIEMKKALVEMGVPAERILVDARARHSTTNLRNAGRIMLKHGLSRALITAPGGGLGRFDQTFYFGNPEVSTFYGRCESELGYRVGGLEWVDQGRVAFTPAPEVRRLNYRDALDP